MVGQPAGADERTREQLRRVDSSHAEDAISPSTGAGPLNDLAKVTDQIAAWRRSWDRVLVIAIDGHGASGKSTIAAALAEILDASVVHTDDFFRWPSGVGADRSTPDDPLGCYYNAARLRAETLEPLRQGRRTTFRRLDRSRNETLETEVTVEPRDVLFVEGVFSAAPQLADLVDRAIFVDTPESERVRRLRQIVAPEDWSVDWLEAERAYFGRIRQPSSFDLTISGTLRLPTKPDGGAP